MFSEFLEMYSILQIAFFVLFFLKDRIVKKNKSRDYGCHVVVHCKFVSFYICKYMLYIGFVTFSITMTFASRKIIFAPTNAGLLLKMKPMVRLDKLKVIG